MTKDMIQERAIVRLTYIPDLTVAYLDRSRDDISGHGGGAHSLYGVVDGVESVESDTNEAVDGGGAEDDIRCDIQLAGPQAGTNLGT